jgi:hypothetical protein
MMKTPFVRRPLERLLAERAVVGSTLDARCAELLRRLREQCPGAVPPPPPKPGGLADPVAVGTDDLERLVRAALSTADADDGVILLADGESELIVDPARTRTLTAEGVVLVVLGVECDQTGPVEVTVPFAAGTENATTGMVLATEQVPRGPEILIRRWGPALVALAWEALLSVTAGLTRHAGTDLDTAPLIPGALLATRSGITVVPQARHETDRLARR